MTIILTMSDLLTPAEIVTCHRLWKQDRANFHERVMAEVVNAAMPRIDRKLGQANHPGYIAYLIEHILTQLEAGE